jgi:phosphatidate cytidylyltransferase
LFPASAKTFDAANLAVRVASAVVFAALLFTLLWFGTQPWAKLAYLGMMAAAAFMGVREAALMGRKQGHFPNIGVGVAIAWAILLHCFLWGKGQGQEELLPLWLVLAGGAMLVHVGPLFTKHSLDNALPSQGLTWLSGLYVGVALGFQQKLFMFNDATLPNTGGRLLLALFLIVWLGDACAYFAGASFGRRKLAPKISPKKTWEGVAGNAAGNLAVAALVKLFLCTDWSWVDAAAIALLLGACSVLGDLAESAWKRSAGLKDSSFGICIPGHGGLLDRIDSLALAAPALYLYVHFVLGLN